MDWYYGLGTPVRQLGSLWTGCWPASQSWQLVSRLTQAETLMYHKPSSCPEQILVITAFFWTSGFLICKMGMMTVNSCHMGISLLNLLQPIGEQGNRTMTLSKSLHALALHFLICKDPLHSEFNSIKVNKTKVSKAKTDLNSLSKFSETKSSFRRLIPTVPVFIKS